MLVQILDVIATSLCTFIVGGSILWLFVELYVLVREIFSSPPNDPWYGTPVQRPMSHQPSVSQASPAPSVPPSSSSGDDDGFATSMALGAAMNDGVTGGLLGGNLVGGVVGDLLVDNQLDFGSHHSGSNDSPVDSTPSYDSSSSSDFSGGSDFGGGSF